MIALNTTTSFLLKRIGVESVSEHEAVYSEEEIKSEGPGKFTVPGGTSIRTINQQLKLQLKSIEAETLSGFLMEKTGQVLTVRERIELDGAVAQVLEISGSRAVSIHMELPQPSMGEI